MGPIDTQPFRQFILAQVNARMDNDICAIRGKLDASIAAFSKQMQKELRKQSDATNKLSQQVAENEEQTERVRLQVAEVGHRADVRHASMSKQIEELTKLVKDMATHGREGSREPRASDARPAGAGSSRDAPHRTTPPPGGPRGGGDPGVLRANTNTGVGRNQVLATVQRFLAAHTCIATDAVRVAGPEAGKAFVLRFSGGHRSDESGGPCLHGVGCRWEMAGPRDAARDGRKHLALRSREVKGKRVAQCVSQRMDCVGVFFRRSDWVVTINRRPLAKIAPAANGEATVLWNAAEVANEEVPKEDILADLATLLPAQPEWSL